MAYFAVVGILVVLTQPMLAQETPIQNKYQPQNQGRPRIDMISKLQHLPPLKISTGVDESRFVQFRKHNPHVKGCGTCAGCNPCQMSSAISEAINTAHLNYGLENAPAPPPGLFLPQTPLKDVPDRIVSALIEGVYSDPQAKAESEDWLEENFPIRFVCSKNKEKKILCWQEASKKADPSFLVSPQVLMHN